MSLSPDPHLTLNSWFFHLLCVRKVVECRFGRWFVYFQPLQCTQHSVLLSFPKVILFHSLFPLDSPQRPQSLRSWKIQEDAFFSLLFKVLWTMTRDSQADYSRNSLNSQNPHSHNPGILYAVFKLPKQFSFLSALHRNGQNSTFYQTSKRNFYSTLIPFYLPTPTVMPPAVTSFSGALAVRHSNLGIITWKLFKFFYAWNNSSYYTFQQSQVVQSGSLGLTLSGSVNCFVQGE